jgi:hypothetical protein
MTPSPSSKTYTSQRQRGYAAVFIDFENIFYYLKDNYADLPDLNDYIFNMLRNLRSHLERKLGLQTIIIKAYADFEQLKSAPQGSLYLMGVETHNVLGTDHKNAADMRLCIDALEVLYTRQEIESFVFLAGDRDYIPVIQHLKKQARTVYAVAFRGNISGDLLLNVGSRYFIDAVTLIDQVMLKRLESSARRQRELERIEQNRDQQKTADLERREADLQKRKESGVLAFSEEKRGASSSEGGDETASEATERDASGDESSSEQETHEWNTSENGTSEESTSEESTSENISSDNDDNGFETYAANNSNGIYFPDSEAADGSLQRPAIDDIEFSPSMPIESEAELICIQVLVRNYGHHHEIWMSPYLRKLSDALPRLADFERKALLTTLEAAGAIRIEKRRGEPYDYSIVLINYNHPAVQEAHE